MSKFSERTGIVAARESLQVDDMSLELRNSLWNCIYKLYNFHYWNRISLYIAENFRRSSIDEIPPQNSSCLNWMKVYFYSLSWHQTYDLIEFIAENHREMTWDFNDGAHSVSDEDVKKLFNTKLERELSAYRFIDGILSRISDKTEVEAISSVIHTVSEIGLTGAHQHLRASLKLLGQKPSPDYRNSIKESISAVESVAKVISGKKSSGLKGAIDELGKASDLHPALKQGFTKLYGYTSDSDGIRHAILDEADVGFAEAKYMLVSCSAFVHYLIQKADNAGLFNREQA